MCHIASHGRRQSTRQEPANFIVATSREKLPEIFSRRALLVEFAKDSLDGVRDFRCGAAIADRPRDGGKLADAPANAKIVGVDHLSIGFDFFTLDADVGDPMLPARVGAAGDMQFEFIGIVGKALIELFGEGWSIVPVTEIQVRHPKRLIAQMARILAAAEARRAS